MFSDLSLQDWVKNWLYSNQQPGSGSQHGLDWMLTLWAYRDAEVCTFILSLFSLKLSFDFSNLLPTFNENWSLNWISKSQEMFHVPHLQSTNAESWIPEIYALFVFYPYMLWSTFVHRCGPQVSAWLWLWPLVKLADWWWPLTPSMSLAGCGEPRLVSSWTPRSVA